MSAALAPRLALPDRTPRDTARRQSQGAQARDRASVRHLLELGELSAAILLAGVVVERDLREMVGLAPQDRVRESASVLRFKERSDERKEWKRPVLMRLRQLALMACTLGLISLDRFRAIEDLRRLRNAVAHPAREPALGPEAGVAVVLRAVAS